MPIINIGNGMFLDTSTGQTSSNLYGSTPSTGALTTSISAPVVQAPAATPAPVTPPAGALTQAIAAPVSTPIGTGGLPAQQAQAAPTAPAVTVPDWFKNTPQYSALFTTVGGTPDYIGPQGDSMQGTPGVTTGPTATQLADAYTKFAADSAGAYNQYADPLMQAATPDYIGPQGDSMQGTPGSISYSMLPENLKHMPGSTGSNMWGLSFDPTTNTFTQKIPGNAGTGQAGNDSYQQYDASGHPIGNPTYTMNSGSGWVDFRNWAEQTVPLILSAGALGSAGIAAEAGAGVGAGTAAAADAAATANALSTANSIAQGASAVNAASNGNYLGAIAAGAGAMGGLSGVPSGGGEALSGMDLAADAGSGANSIDAASNALSNGTGALSTGINLKNVADAAKIANSIKNGDYANALIGGVNMSGQLPATIDGVSTTDMTKLANAALAISSGNPAALVNSMINSGKTWDAANNVWNDAVGVSTTPMTDAYLASPTTDTQAALDALSLVDGPNPNPEAYALPTDLTPTNSAADQAANAAQDALLNGGALTQVVSNPTDQRLADGTQTTPGALTDVINAPAEPNAVPLDNVTVTGTQYPPADQAVQDALNQYSTEAPNAVPLDNVTVTGTQYPPADQAVMDALNQYSTEAPNAVPLDKVTVTGTQPPLSDLVPTEVNAPPTVVPVIAETPPATVPTVPTIPSVPVVPKKTAPATPKTIAPLPQQVANHLPGVDMSFLNPGATIDENKLMPMAQALVDQSNGTLTLPEALGMVKQNQPKGKQ